MVVIVADAFRTNLACHAAHFLQFNADTEVALLNAMIHTIIDEGLIATDFIEARISNFAALKRNAKDFSPEKMAPMCGIPAPTIRKVARLFATSRGSMILWGMGITQHVHGTDNVRCLIALSHSDVDLVEDSPSRYDVDVKRRHRWMRGDWQVAGWLLPRLRPPVADAGDPDTVRRRSVPNPLSSLSRCKILDNLRRSVAPIALIATFVLGWTVLQPPWLWTLAGLGVVFLPALLGPLTELARKHAGPPLRQHIEAVVASTLRGLALAGLALACLPYEAWVSADAIGRTFWRMRLSGRRLLEWQPCADASVLS